MRILKRYYKKIYKYTDKLLKKVFGMNVIDSMRKTYDLKKSIEKKINKPIDEITADDLIKNKLSVDYCEYRTLNEILGVLSGASFLNIFREEELKEIENENK